MKVFQELVALAEEMTTLGRPQEFWAGRVVQVLEANGATRARDEQDRVIEPVRWTYPEDLIALEDHRMIVADYAGKHDGLQHRVNELEAVRISVSEENDRLRAENDGMRRQIEGARPGDEPPDTPIDTQ